MKPKRPSTGQAKPSDQVACYFPFRPDGKPTLSKGVDFITLYLEARAWKNEQEKERLNQEEKKLAQAAKALARKQSGRRKSEKSPEELFAAEFIDSLEKKIAEEPGWFNAAWLAENKKKLVEMGLFELAAGRIKVRDEEAKLEENSQVLHAAETARNGISTLIHFAFKKTGNAQKQAAEALFELCLDGTALLQRLYQDQPDLFRDKARFYSRIPVLAGLDPKWKTRVQQAIQQLRVGSALPEGNFKEVAYDDGVHVCRRWAREAVNCLSHNQYAPAYLVEICDYMQSNPQVMVRLSEMPNWLTEACALKPFSRSTAKEWGRVARLMIRDQCPDFHQLPEFAPLAHGIKTRLRDSPSGGKNRIGTVQSRLLDKIVEAIETIAGESNELAGKEPPEFQ